MSLLCDSSVSLAIRGICLKEISFSYQGMIALRREATELEHEDYMEGKFLLVEKIYFGLAVVI